MLGRGAYRSQPTGIWSPPRWTRCRSWQCYRLVCCWRRSNPSLCCCRLRYIASCRCRRWLLMLHRFVRKRSKPTFYVGHSDSRDVVPTKYPQVLVPPLLSNSCLRMASAGPGVGFGVHPSEFTASVLVAVALAGAHFCPLLLPPLNHSAVAVDTVAAAAAAPRRPARFILDGCPVGYLTWSSGRKENDNKKPEGEYLASVSDGHRRMGWARASFTWVRAYDKWFYSHYTHSRSGLGWTRFDSINPSKMSALLNLAAQARP